jgi:ATP-dependent DNA helicase RecQ
MQNPKNILKEVYGYDEFRPLQQDIIEHTLSGQNSVVIMPTGGGKSVCFQIPALIFDKVTLVISPLISLMRDQVESLKANGVAAAYFNSSQSDFEKRLILEECRANKLKLLYLSPETLVHAFESWLKDIPVSFVAVDEAHCVSMWGHDFRPEYAQLKNFRNHYKNVPFMALTATADKITRKDIADQLGLEDPQLFLASFNRSNLSLAVRSQVPAKQKEKEIIQFIGERKNECGIIYCLSRKETEKWSAFLNSNGFNARHYHAGMSSESREAVQDGFINDQFTIICATIAFGMGIDKSNVRWIIHNNLPKNIEGYYQEIGRAGRDGLPSDTVLYYNYRDVILLNDFVKESEFKETYLEKIKRIIQYAEATSCRRNILLSYFGEYNDEPCNNCDVCQNPPEFLDGKVITQMAISAILRTQENIGTTMLINILRGAKTGELFEKNYQKIKTYGVGQAHSYSEWQYYINQLINLGFIEIAYDDH